MDLDDKKILISKYLTAYNDFDIAEMLQTLSDDIQFENVQSNEVNASAKGKTEFQKLAERAALLFSERNQAIESIRNEAEKTVVNITYYGKLASDLPNGMKAGEEISLKGISEFTFSDNKISSIRDIS